MKVMKDGSAIASETDYGPDPVLLKKIGQSVDGSKDLRYYKEKIADKKYLDYAINRIAMELSHFLSR